MAESQLSREISIPYAQLRASRDGRIKTPPALCVAPTCSQLGKHEYSSLFHQCHQGRNGEEKRVSLSYPTTRKTPKLMGRSAHEPMKGWVFWAHQVMNGKWNPTLFQWADPFQPDINHYCVLYWIFSSCSSTVFLALPAFDTPALEGTQSLPAIPLLVVMWVVCEGRLTRAIINLHKNDDINCLFNAHL